MTRVRLVVAAASAAVVLGVATTVTLAATGALDGRGPTAPWRAGARCTAPALPGRVVDVTVTDLGSMMGGGPGTGPGRYGTGMMRLLAAPGTVPAGTVSLRVVNAGSLPHEVLVLPLAADGVPGARPAGPDGRVDEAGSLGEASRDCGAGEGDGIAPGSAAWTTLTLRPGRYELLCNLPGHYAAGMYAELDVTAR